jgi:hypothetical protein
MCHNPNCRRGPWVEGFRLPGVSVEEDCYCAEVVPEDQFEKSGVNFTNIFRVAFMRPDPKSVKKIDSLTIFFALLGSGICKSYM